MDANRRRPVPLSEAGGWTDDVARMQAFLARHPGVTWLRPVNAAGAPDPGHPHTAVWEEDGTTVTAERVRLGHLVDYLEDRFDGAAGS
jgi:hypothetical protein